MKTNKYLILLLLFIMTFIVEHCHRTEYKNPISINFHNLPLKTIQTYINGMWKLKYTTGGIAFQKIKDPYNTYYSFASDHLIIGNDQKGVYIDTIISWELFTWNNDSVYTFVIPSTNNNPPLNKVVDQIKNDTLIIRDLAKDAFTYYLIK